MKKQQRLICLLLALVLFLLPGCTADRPDATEDTTGSAQEASTADVSDVTEDTAGAVQENSGTKGPDATQQNEIYFAAGNDYYDLYYRYSWMPGPEITLLSSEHIDPECIQVSADIKAKYSVFVYEQETGRGLTKYQIVGEEGSRYAYEMEVVPHALPLYIYQTYAGMDWAELGRLYTEYSELREKYENQEATLDEMNAAGDRYWDADAEYVAEYSKINVEDIPEYYLYTISFYIDAAEEEELFTTVQVTIGDTVYDVNIGEIYIRLNSDTDTNSAAHDYLSFTNGSPLWLNCYPYGSGIEKCQSTTYYAKTALTLTGLRFLENTKSSAQVLDVVAVISDDPYSGAGIEIEWDGVTPIYMEQGKYVTLHMTVQDERLKEINYHSSIYPVLEFECDGAVYEQVGEIPLFRYYNDRWLLYAMAVGGLDMESYFNDYHYLTVNEVWRNDVDLTPWEQKK